MWLWRSLPLLRPTVPDGVRRGGPGPVQPEVPLLSEQSEQRGAALLLRCESSVRRHVHAHVDPCCNLSSSCAGGGDGEEPRRVPFSNRNPAVTPLHGHGGGLLQRGHDLGLHAHEAQVQQGIVGDLWPIFFSAPRRAAAVLGCKVALSSTLTGGCKHA